MVARRPRPTAGLSAGERRVFWHVYGACGSVNSVDIDLDAHCREIAKTVVWHQTHPMERKQAG